MRIMVGGGMSRFRDSLTVELMGRRDALDINAENKREDSRMIVKFLVWTSRWIVNH